jgi:hypothetical protein
MLSDDLLAGAKAAAAFMGVTPRVVYGLTYAGQIPTIRKGKRLYYRKSDLERAFSAEGGPAANNAA